MKRKFIFVLSLFMLAYTLSTAVYAEYPNGAHGAHGTLGTYGSSESAEVSISDIRGYIPEEALELLPDELFDSGSGGVVSAFSFSYFAKLFFSLLSKAAEGSAVSLGGLLGLVVISSAFHCAADITARGSLKGAFESIASLCVCLSVFGSVGELAQSVNAHMQNLAALVNTMSPLVTTAYVSGGNLSAAAVNSAGLLVCLSVLENIVAYGLFPILELTLALAICKSAAPKLRIDTFASFVRGFFMLAIGLAVAAISAVMSFQSTLAAAADSVSSRAIRFAASSFIPIVGGAVSEAVRTMSGSISAVRSAVGGIGIAAIAVMTLPTLISLMIVRVRFALAASFADLLSCERECKLIKEGGSAVNFLIALVSLMSVMFIYALSLLVGCAVSYS